MKRINQIAARALLGLFLLVVILYAIDYGSVTLRMRQNKPGDPLEAMQVQRTYAIPHKDGRAEYVFGPRETQTCVHSIFPHLGYLPCWYLKRSSRQPIPM
jgi:hypothetical protein